MAVPGDIQIGRISRFFTKWLGSKGSSPRLAFGGEINGVIPIWSGVENRYLDSWGLFGTTLLVGAAASNQSAAQFRNPVGSKLVAVFHKIIVGTPAAAGTTIVLSNGAQTTDLASVLALTASRLDARGQPQPASTVSQQNTTPAPGDLNNALGRVFVGQVAGALPQIDLILTDDQEIPLLPGDALRIRNATVNQELDVTVWWRERSLEDSELA